MGVVYIHRVKVESGTWIKVEGFLLGELTIRSVERILEKEINRIENVRHANENLDSVTL